jgi:uncharacterized protein (TIGR00255 family)
MIHSMTGFGKASETYQGKKITVEIRALNSKGLDLNVRMPSAYRQEEMNWRKTFGDSLERGKIDVQIGIEGGVDQSNNIINKSLASAYYNDIKELERTLGIVSQDYLSIILKMPEIFSTEKLAVEAEELTTVEALIHLAISDFNAFRAKEGAELEKEFTLCIDAIKSLLLEVPQYESERINRVRERMEKAFADLTNVPIDQNRMEQELIFWVEKMDISEEKMRLANHLEYFMETMKNETSGKKLGFITQEIGREINTLGSKSYHVEMQKKVVLMKDYLERIKEQILNTL